MDIDINNIRSINWVDKTILVAEDDDVNYKLLETVLQRTQARVLRARSGIEAVDLCKGTIQINVVLMDIKMPLMNGYEATVIIKSIRPDLPVIAQTAFSSQEEIIRCTDAGCIDFITKPIQIRLLIEKISQHS